MSTHLLAPPLPVRFVGRHDCDDFEGHVHAVCEVGGRLLIHVNDEKGFYCLSTPHCRSSDGVVNVVWVEDPTVFGPWEAERPSYPRLSAV